MSEERSLAGRAAIAGIGATDFSKASGRTELHLACEAVAAAIADAGVRPNEVDGIVAFSYDTAPDIEIARALGLGELSFMALTPHGGGGAAATVMQAAMAVATGTADVVVCYRSLNARSGRRLGAGSGRHATVLQGATADMVHMGWYAPYGLITPAGWVGMVARRYLETYGATTDAFGWVSRAARRHAATNPAAWFYGQPITMEDHHASRWIAEPLRLLDCCQESDGAVAIVVTTPERARDLKAPAVIVRAATQGSGLDQEMMTSYTRPSIEALPEMAVAAAGLWKQAGIGPIDVQAAILYDHFTPYVVMQLEELGFCGRGEAPDFVADGALEIGGRLPINTNGGQLGEAYIHGMNGIAEAVRQVRGTAVNQVPDVEHVLVTSGTGVPTSAMVLGR